MSFDDDPVRRPSCQMLMCQPPVSTPVASSMHAGILCHAAQVLNQLSSPKNANGAAEAMDTVVPRGSRGMRGSSPERSGPVIDADGFETVSRKKKGGRR